MMTSVASFIVSLGSASRDQIGGALSSAAVPRGGLGPPAPPLCRYAERITDLISKRRWLSNGRTLAVSGLDKVADSQPQRTHHARRLGAWGDWRSGIKEEAAALGRNGGQPRSQSPQVPGHTKIQTQQSGKFRKAQKP